jgi:hypothetical protein
MPLDKTDIPGALDNLDNRVSKLEATTTEAPQGGTVSDPRVDDIYVTLERYFGKELAEAKANREAPATQATAPVQSGPTVNAGAGQPTSVAPGPGTATPSGPGPSTTGL